MLQVAAAALRRSQSLGPPALCRALATKLPLESIDKPPYKRLSEQLSFKDIAVGDLALSKSTAQPPILDESIPIGEAVKVMNKFGIGCVLVKKEGKVNGIFSERDFMRKVASEDIDIHKVPVKDVMDTNVTIISPGTTAVKAMEIMTEKDRRRYLPMRDPKTQEIVDVISLGDLVKGILGQSVESIVFLTDFIGGSYCKSSKATEREAEAKRDATAQSHQSTPPKPATAPPSDEPSKTTPANSSWW